VFLFLSILVSLTLAVECILHACAHLRSHLEGNIYNLMNLEGNILECLVERDGSIYSSVACSEVRGLQGGASRRMHADSRLTRTSCLQRRFPACSFL
jgi:hypothetical protein